MFTQQLEKAIADQYFELIKKTNNIHELIHIIKEYQNVVRETIHVCNWIQETDKQLEKQEQREKLEKTDSQIVEMIEELFGLYYSKFPEENILTDEDIKKAEKRKQFINNLQHFDVPVKTTKTSTKKKEGVKSAKNVKIDEPKSFKDTYKKENTYQKLIAILKDKNIDNLGCNSINYCLNTYFNKGKFTTKQADLTPEQLEEKNKWIEENINDIKKFNSTEEIIEFIADALMTFGSEQQQKQLNYSLNYVRKNG